MKHKWILISLGLAGAGVALAANPPPSSALTIKKISATQVQLSWPGSGVLQQTTNLPPTWVDVTNTPSVINGTNYVTQPIQSQRFFRLRS